MRLWRTRGVLALLHAALALALPGLAHAGTQWSGIKGRAVLESFIITQYFTNIVPGRPPVIGMYSSNYVAVRSPIKTTIRVYAAKSGRLIRTIDTDDSGRFVVRLQPGLYRLEPAVIRDGHVLGPGQAITMDMNHVIQTAPIQTVRVGGFRYADVAVVYHTTWPAIRYLPDRPVRVVPGTGPATNVPSPQPGGSILTIEAVRLISGRPMPPLPPSPNTPPLPVTPYTPPPSLLTPPALPPR